MKDVGRIIVSRSGWEFKAFAQTGKESEGDAAQRSA